MRYTQLLAALLSAALLTGCASDAAPDGSAGTGAPDLADSSGSAPSVQVDWSVLGREKTTWQADVDGGRWFPDYMDHLVTGENYGVLVPYRGANIYSFSTWTDSDGQEQTWYSPWATPRYGLMTREGKVVTDPVYRSAFLAENLVRGASVTLPVLLLSQAKEEWDEYNNGIRYAAAALDGSWCTEFAFWNYTVREDQLLLTGPAGLTRLNSADGSRRDWSWEDLGVGEEELPDLLENLTWLYGFSWTDQGVYLGEKAAEERTNQAEWDSAQVRMFRPDTGEVFWTSRAQWGEWLDQWSNQRQNGEYFDWQLDQDGTQITLTQGETRYTLTSPVSAQAYFWQVRDNLALINLSGEEDSALLFDLDTGELLLLEADVGLLPTFARPETPTLITARAESGALTIYTADLTPVLSFPPLGADRWYYYDLSQGLLSVYDDGTFFGCYDTETWDCVFYRNLTLGD